MLAINRYREGIKGFTFALVLFLLTIIVTILPGSGEPVEASEVLSKVPDLCYKCHSQMKQELGQPYVHFPFSQGKCDTCHVIHAGKYPGLVKEEINKLCLGCHKELRKSIREKRVHGAIKDGKCTDCHVAHSSKYSKLLTRKESELCSQCHEISAEDLRLKTSVHQPYKQGKCSSCHNAHVADRDSLLRSEPSTLCAGCHEPRCKFGTVSIAHLTKSMDCTGCHSGHDSSSASLLGPFGHPAFLNKQCEKCHNPVTEGGAMTTRGGGTEVCFRCHKKEPGMFESSNVHYQVGPNPCIVCHEVHGSDKPSFTVNEQSLCIKCHEDVYKSTARMEKALKSVRCLPVKNRKCFDCHSPLHSSEPFFFRVSQDVIKTCSRCHEAQHKITHPLGAEVIDPRNGQPITCKSCHSMHNGQAKFMLQFDRNRELCIQCHKT